MRRATVIVALVAATLATAGCGQIRSGDLFLVHRVGAIPGARLTLLVNDTGHVTCNHTKQGELTSHQLLIARQIVRDLKGLKGNGDGNDTEGPADKDLHLQPQPGSILTYEVRVEVGTVGFSDNSRGQPQVFYDIGAFTREVAKGLCGLPR